MSEVGLSPEQIVFEATETERVPSSTAHLLNILDHLLDDPFRAVIAEKGIEVALGTGMAIVAEGIESAESANWFASRGVHYLQGYHFARPAALPPRTFAH